MSAAPRPVPRGLFVAVALAALAVLLVAARANAGPAPAVATDSLHLTLEGAVAWALAHGNEMKAATAGIGAAEGRVKEVMAQALPQVTGTASYNRKLDSIFQGVAESDTSGIGDIFANSPFGAIHGWTLDLTMSQLIWSGGRVGAGLAAARAVRKAVTSDREQVGDDVTLQVQEAYWNALYVRELVRIAENTLALAREQLSRAQLNRNQGAGSEYDMLQSQVDAANQEPLLVSARSASEVALLDLKRVLNLPLDQPLVLDSPLAFEGDQLPVPSESPSDVSGRPALVSADALVQARDAALRAERAGYWPNITASATMSHQAFPPDGLPVRREFARSMDANVKLEWPLFQGFRTFGGVQRASNELNQAMARRDALKQSVELELAQARLGVQEALATLAARRGTARLAERTHHLAVVRWQNGLSTQLEVSTARLRMQNTQANEVQALKDYRLSLARLDRAAGRTVPTTPRSLDDLSYDPTPKTESKP